ncbi:ArsR/SmtB family transcription factor [Phenylobacterium soli]|uniref:Transcriptional regulator n=1 Tax=Phenylobacterium soli TaxID=2170551 RepID=A0A328ANJ4_9CAUL|nr:transcriptional regulator [Phenylobacterium soli]
MATLPTDTGATLPDPAQLEQLNDRAAQASRMLKLLASEQRLRILCRLGEGEASVNELAHYAGLAQAATSQHLAKLRAEHIVEVRREGQTIYYSLKDPAAVRMIDTLCEIYGPA